MKRLYSAISILILSFSVFAQSGEIAPNENLVAEGIPKIPASLAESVARYSEFRSAGFASWNPVKREMLIITSFGRHSPGPPGEVPRRSSLAAHFLPRSSLRSRIRTYERRVILVREGCRRR